MELVYYGLFFVMGALGGYVIGILDGARLERQDNLTMLANQSTNHFRSPEDAARHAGV